MSIDILRTPKAITILIIALFLLVAGTVLASNSKPANAPAKHLESMQSGSTDKSKIMSADLQNATTQSSASTDPCERSDSSETTDSANGSTNEVHTTITCKADSESSSSSVNVTNDTSQSAESGNSSSGNSGSQTNTNQTKVNISIH